MIEHFPYNFFYIRYIKSQTQNAGIFHTDYFNETALQETTDLPRTTCSGKFSRAGTNKSLPITQYKTTHVTATVHRRALAGTHSVELASV